LEETYLSEQKPSITLEKKGIRKRKISEIRGGKIMNYESEGVVSTPITGTGSTPLAEAMSKILSISDVTGAAIIKSDGTVIFWHTKNGEESVEELGFIREFVAQNHRNNLNYLKTGMFTESILDYNGHKILVGRIRSDLILLLELEKRAYIGLTMLLMEGCIREIDKSLDEHCHLILKVPS